MAENQVLASHKSILGSVISNVTVVHPYQDLKSSVLPKLIIQLWMDIDWIIQLPNVSNKLQRPSPCRTPNAVLSLKLYYSCSYLCSVPKNLKFNGESETRRQEGRVQSFGAPTHPTHPLHF